MLVVRTQVLMPHLVRWTHFSLFVAVYRVERPHLECPAAGGPSPGLYCRPFAGPTTESARKWANERTLGSKNLRTFPCKRPTRGSENLGVSWIPKISTHNDKKWVLIRYSAHFLLHMNTPRAMVSLHELESYRSVLWDFRILRHDTMAQRMRWRLCRRHTCARASQRSFKT